MPDGARHSVQSQHNFDFMSKHALKGRHEYSDWCITVCFYAALHLIDQKLAGLTDEIYEFRHPPNHKFRNQAVAGPLNDLYPGIETKYMKLYSLSQIARYDCVALSSEDVDKAVLLYRGIETTLSGQPANPTSNSQQGCP